jgi:hypothetical protein
MQDDRAQILGIKLRWASRAEKNVGGPCFVVRLLQNSGKIAHQSYYLGYKHVSVRGNVEGCLER